MKKHPLQNRTNVQIKGGGVNGLLNNVQKNFTFPSRWLPLELFQSRGQSVDLNMMMGGEKGGAVQLKNTLYDH